MKTLRSLLLVMLATSFFIPLSQSQESVAEQQQIEEIKIRPFFPFLSNQYQKNERRYPMGLTYKKMAFEFEQTPAAMIDYQTAHQKAKRATAFTFIGLGAILVGTQLMVSNNQKSNETEFKQTPLSFTITLAGGLSLVIGQFIFYNSRKELNRAIQKRNKAFLLLR